jgi:m7GpppX diphosphatase
VYNILDHTSEQDRVRFEDKDPQTGFILVLDLKWDEKTVETLYLLGICHVPGITCLRDLGEQHLPLLKNMLSKGRAAISEHYGLPARQIKVYVHYQPSFYHFHVHYVHILLDDPGGVVGHAHLLEDVIDNIEHISPRYYQDCTLTYSLRKEDMLWKEMEKTGQLTDY